MIMHAWTRLGLFGSLALSIGCVDNKVDDDDTNGDTDSADADTDAESDSTDADTDATGSTDADTNATESTTDATDSTDSTDSSTDSTDTGDPVMCPDVFPTFDKTCGVDSDCALVLHTINCCGTEVAWGISTSETAAFEAAETTCDSQYPECDCAAFPTLAEDGNEVMDANQLAVTCQMGACMSYVP